MTETLEEPYAALRIAVVCGDRGIAAAGRGGASEHLRSMCAGFLSLGAEVELWCQRLSPGGSVPDAPLPTGLVTLESPRGRLPGALRKYPPWDHAIDANAMSHWLLRQGKRFRPDVVYERFSMFSTPGVRVARRLGIPYVVELNAPLVWEAALFRGLAARPAFIRREARALTRADLLICVSPALREYAIFRGVEPSRIVVVPNGASAVHPRSLLSRTKDERSKAKGAFVLGYAGSFKAWQGLVSSIAQLVELRATVAPRTLHLDLWGDGPERALFAAGVLEEDGITLSLHGWGSAEQLACARASWDAAWVPLAPWPPAFSTDGRSLEELEASFGEPAPSLYFSPLKEAEARRAGLDVWPEVAAAIPQERPRSWQQIAEVVLSATGFPPRSPRGKMYAATTADPQASA